MKKETFVLLAGFLLMAGSLTAADTAAAVTKTTDTAVALTKTASAPAPAAITKTAAAANTPVAAASAVSATATPFIEGVMPPAMDAGAYEEPGEPAPTAEEANKAAEKKSEARKSKHFTIEQTLFTKPGALGERIGYFINENWRVTAEYSTISKIMADYNHERNMTWAVSGNYSPADDDWSPFYGVGFTMMDVYFKDKDTDSINFYHTQQFTGGYLNVGVTWITDSILMASIEFDLYAGRTRDIKDYSAVDASKSKDETTPDMRVIIGGTIGLCF